MKLPRIKFEREEIELKLLYENKEVLDSIKSTSESITTPKKVLDVYGPLFFPRPIKDRPYIIGGLVLTLDGKLGFQDENKSTLISKGNVFDPGGGLADLWIVNLLRTYCDAIVFGGKTLQVEDNITGHIYDEELEFERLNVLNKSQKIPWNIIVSRNGLGLPLNHKILNTDIIPSIIITSQEGYNNIKDKLSRKVIIINTIKPSDKNIRKKLISRSDEIVIIIAGKDNKINTKDAMKILRLLGIKTLLIESPTYIYSMMELEIIDELFINYSGLYAGGNLSPGNLFPFKLNKYPGAELLSLHMHSPYFLYTRQKLRYHNN